MAAWRRAIELSLGDADTAKLRSIAQSRTEPASRVERARILLAYREDPSFFAVARALGLHHQTVQRCVARHARAHGPAEGMHAWPIWRRAQSAGGPRSPIQRCAARLRLRRPEAERSRPTVERTAGSDNLSDPNSALLPWLWTGRAGAR